jgi:predicted ferric reductase
MALFFYLYKVFLYRFLGPHYRYQVTSVKQLDDIIEIYLSPLGKILKFSPGQYAFVSFNHPDLSETHPFSFSSAPEDDQLRFSVKISGDYTLKLKNITVGTIASVWGAYGRFTYKFFGDRDVVCLAGGIGITPFLSLLLTEIKKPIVRQIYLFYSAKTESQAIYHQTLLNYASTIPNLHYIPYFTDQKPRLTASFIADSVNGLSHKLFYLCGPTPMMLSLTDQLISLKVNRSDIIFEDFSFK